MSPPCRTRISRNAAHHVRLPAMQSHLELPLAPAMAEAYAAVAAPVGS